MDALNLKYGDTGLRAFFYDIHTYLALDVLKKLGLVLYGELNGDAHYLAIPTEDILEQINPLI